MKEKKQKQLPADSKCNIYLFKMLSVIMAIFFQENTFLSKIYPNMRKRNCILTFRKWFTKFILRECVQVLNLKIQSFLKDECFIHQ